ncbi:MAG TPA: TolC family protein [Bacteroidia bacterium]|nr:TolC family protein [Bacteroidia bacterium]HQF28582.1 TolC family protein [Bacteroidia bacterium]
MTKTGALILLLLLNSLSVKSQDTIPIKQEELWPRAEKGNYQLKMSDQEYKSAKADYHQSNALFLPNVTISNTAINTTNPLMAFGSKLNQEILTPADFNPDLLNNPDQIRNYSTKVEVLQPLINADGILERRAAKIKMQAYSLKSERTKQYLQMEIQKAYIQLQLVYKAYDVLKIAERSAANTEKMIRDYYDQGYVQKTDVLNVEVHVGELKNQIALAQSNIHNASTYLSFLLGENLGEKVFLPQDKLDTTSVSPETNEKLNEMRSDIKAMQLSAEAYNKIYQSKKFNFLPRLNAFGTYEIYDDQIFGTDAEGYLIGVQLSWNIFDGYKSIGKLEKSRAEYNHSGLELQQYKSQSQMELSVANRKVLDAYNTVNNKRNGFLQSKEAYRIRSDRFAQGLEKANDVLQSETQSSMKELEYYQSIYEYNLSKLNLEFLSK